MKSSYKNEIVPKISIVEAIRIVSDYTANDDLVVSSALFSSMEENRLKIQAIKDVIGDIRSPEDDHWEVSVYDYESDIMMIDTVTKRNIRRQKLYYVFMDGRIEWVM